MISDVELIRVGRKYGKNKSAFQEKVKTALKPTTKEFYLAIDGVLAAYLEHLINYLHLPLFPLTSPLDPRLMLNCYKVQKDLSFWQSIPLYDIAGMGDVKAYLCNRHEDLLPITEIWLEDKELPEAPIITCSYDQMPSYVPKSAFVLSDNVDAVTALRKTGVESYIIDRPWNQNWVTPYRVMSIAEFYQKPFIS